MPEEFRYLVKKERKLTSDSPSTDCVEDAYTPDMLADRLVVRDELKWRYLVFKSKKEFLEWHAEVPEAERCFHEVIFGRHKQRLKFDVDALGVKLDMIPDDVFLGATQLAAAQRDREVDALVQEFLEYTPEAAPSGDVALTTASKAEAVVSLLLEAILDELYVAYYGLEDLCPTREDIAVTESSGPTAEGWKYSFHVLVLPWCVEDNIEASEFTARVLGRLPSRLRWAIDTGVNKRVQNFRLTGSTKTDKRRYKRACPDLAQRLGTALKSMADLFVTAPRDAQALPRVYTDSAEKTPVAAVLGPGSPAIRAVLELGERTGATAGHTYSESRGTLLCFRREVATFCRLCGETHSKDNSLMLSLEPVESGHSDAWPGTGEVECRVKEHCRQARGRALLVGTLTLPAEHLREAGHGRPPRAARGPVRSPGLQARIEERVGAIQKGLVDPHASLASAFETLPAGRKTVYAEPEMREYELVPTLGVAAQMKMGKTKALRRYIDTHFAAEGLDGPIVRVVTFRQTFSHSIAESLPGFTLYDAVRGDLGQARYPRLIVQVESLHRLRLGAYPEPVDLLVLDEAESVLAQFDSGLHRHFNAAFAMLKWMLRTARHVVCMDANLGDRAYQALTRLRPDNPPHFHWNRYQRAAGDTFRFTADQGVWLSRLYAALREGQHVVAPTNSLAEARALEAGLRREFPAKKVALYSSETPASEKTRDFSDVHTYWSGLDVLIFTPTCSAGVSYELAHYDSLFAFFCDESCDVETCRQMLGRVRDLCLREHVICLRASGASLPATADAIRGAIYRQRAGLHLHDYEGADAALQVEYADDGSVRFYESDYFYLWLETTRVRNLSRNDFARRFVDQVADTGAHVAVLAPEDGTLGAAAALLLDHRSTRGEMAAARHEAVAAARDLEPEEAARLREDHQNKLDVDPADLLALEKFQLRDTYVWHGRPLDGSFVAAYNNPGTRRVYRNLSRITEGTTVYESLQLIRAKEARHYEWALDARVERDSLNYVHESHYLAIWLLNLCGFSFADKQHISEEALEARLRAASAALEAGAPRAVFTFEIPRPDFARLAREPDRARFLSGALRFVNSVLRVMYGLQVRRVPLLKNAGPESRTYFLDQNSTGRLFVFSNAPEPDDTPGGPRPHIRSNLRVAANDHATLFLEQTFYATMQEPPQHPVKPVKSAFKRPLRAAALPRARGSAAEDDDFLLQKAREFWPGAVFL